MSTKRLSLTRNGQLRYELKTIWRNGTTHVKFEPLEYISRLVSLVHKPRINLTRFYGVFAPNSKCRALVTPAKRGRGKTVKALNDQTPAEKRASMTWVKRLKQVFDIDIETCPANEASALGMILTSPRHSLQVSIYPRPPSLDVAH